MNERIIRVADEFSPTPIGRYPWQGRFSGEAFRTGLFSDAIRQHEFVVVDLDGTSGLSTGFLDEAFAGVIRERVLAPEDFRRRIKFVSVEDPYLIEDIWNYVGDAERKLG